MATTATVAAIIPALNEETTIGAVVGAVPRDVVQRVIVVDNGSTDQTVSIAQANGAEIVTETRRGYGYACYAGAAAATDAAVLVFLDGDGSDDPTEIPLLLAPIHEQAADLVIGSRERGYHEPGALLPHARFGNGLAALLMRWLYGLKVTDLGPFRAIRQPVYASLDMQELTYGWTTEMMVKAAKQNYKIVEIPISYYRRAGGKSKISGTIRGTILAAYYIISTTIKYAYGR
ncbi:MAG: glycosyltransferase family 2 protein [Chloroflexi bacterium]|nr:glycosyltransferase family 2 protein [Chloroflexota bacterium]